jgi:hypothetical protein
MSEFLFYPKVPSRVLGIKNTSTNIGNCVGQLSIQQIPEIIYRGKVYFDL